MRSLLLALLAATAPLVLGGCMGSLSKEGPETLTVDRAQYGEALDAAARIARDMGYKVAVVDRSNGVIETDPRHAGGALEPWRLDNGTADEVASNTFANRRRRIRFEFVPVGVPPTTPTQDGVLHGAAIPGSTAALQRFDVQSSTGPIEVTIRVTIERSFLEGSRPSTYSGSLASRWSNPLNAKPAGAADDSVRDNPRWVPVGRDAAYERTIAAKLEAATRAQ